MYHGLGVMGGGSILAGLILGAVATFIIDLNFVKAAGFATAGAIMTFFGFMHGEAIGINKTPAVAAAYLAVAAVLFGCAKFSGVVALEPEHEEYGEEPEESLLAETRAAS